MKITILPKCKFNADATIASQLYAFLRRQITESCIVPGTPLTENELAMHFGISRQPVRQALMKLSRDGLVEIIPQRGSFVKKISASNLKGICFIRSAIECSALAEAKHMSSKNYKQALDRLASNLKRQQDLVDSIDGNSSMESADFRARYLRLDDRFHAILCSFSGTDMAWETIQSINANMDRIRYLSLGEFSEPEALMQDHECIYQYISEREIDKALEVLRAHLYEITSTYKPIRRKNIDWFMDEDK